METQMGETSALAKPECKTIYLIRHGQSEWNAAVKARSLRRMLLQRDHPLTPRGLLQARALATALQQLDDDDDDDTADKDTALSSIGDAGAVWSSPLARALQTALVGTRPLLDTRSLLLEPLLREKKNLGSVDSLGARRGSRCVDRALERLPHENSATDLEQVDIDAAKARSKWWNSGVERRSSVRARAKRLLRAVEVAQHESIILVGHSIFFRELLRSSLSPSALSSPPELAERLTRHKLPHCSVLRCELDFSLPSGRVICAMAHSFSPNLPDESVLPRSRFWRRRRAARRVLPSRVP